MNSQDYNSNVGSSCGYAKLGSEVQKEAYNASNSPATTVMPNMDNIVVPSYGGAGYGLSSMTQSGACTGYSTLKDTYAPSSGIYGNFIARNCQQ